MSPPSSSSSLSSLSNRLTNLLRDDRSLALMTLEFFLAFLARMALKGVDFMVELVRGSFER
jgi:hypothetical protein